MDLPFTLLSYSCRGDLIPTYIIQYGRAWKQKVEQIKYCRYSVYEEKNCQNLQRMRKKEKITCDLILELAKSS